MDAYCPRCQTSTHEVDEAILQKGECPTCGGQMSLGAVASDSPVDGAIAMTFGAGSRIAMPLDASFEQTRIDSGRAQGGAALLGMENRVKQPSARRPPRPPPDALSVSDGLDDEWEAPGGGFSGEETPVPGGPPGLEASDLPNDVEASDGPSPSAVGARVPTVPSALPDETTAKTSAESMAGLGLVDRPVPPVETEAHLQASWRAQGALGAAGDSREEGAEVSDESTIKGSDDSSVGDAEAPGDGPGLGGSTTDVPARLEASFGAEAAPEKPPGPGDDGLPAAATNFGLGPTMEVPAHLQATLNAEAAVGNVEDQAAEHGFSTARTEVGPAELSDEPTVKDEQPAAGSGAHLQLPSIDFSIPDLGTGSTDLPATTSSPSSAPSTDLPAHLQLPSFPDFELPPIPGEESETGGGSFSIEGVGGGSFGDAQTAVTPSEPGTARPDQAEGWQVTTAERGAPPPLPEPPPIRAPKKEPALGGLPDLGAAPGGGGALPDLPAFGLPALDAKKSEPTLVQTNVALQLSRDEPGKRSLGSKIAIVLLVLLGLVVGSVVTVATVGVDDAMKWVNPPKERSAAELRREKADAAYYDGVARYKEALAAEEAKKSKLAKKAYEAAVVKFNEALEHEPSYGDAQRNLGIVFAKLNNQREAVKHYRLYLKVKPKAKDKKDVLKIINDYEEAQQKLKKRK